MKKIYRRLTSMLVAVAILFSFTATAFASEEADKETDSIANTFLSYVIASVSANYKFGITEDELYKNALRHIMAENPELVEVALEGIYQSLDKYSSYFTMEEYQTFIESVAGEFCGIGVTIMEFDEGLLVTEVHKDSAAEKVGLRKGDYIISADGTDIRNMDLETARSYIVGPQGTSVNIGIVRDGVTMNFDLVRSIVTAVSGFYQILDGNVGYIQLSSFDEHSPEFMKEALDKLKDTQNIIFDLRYNPGGSLDALQKIAELTLPKGPIMHLEYKNPINNKTIENAIGDNTHKFVVLVNNYTASAAEAYAAAVQDYGVGVVVGEQTTGKGTMQITAGMLTGGGHKLTVAEYLSPKKRIINEIGVEPDYKVKPQEVTYSDIYFEKATFDRVMKKGDRGKDVLAFEQRLNTMGYSLGVPDEEYNEETYYAVKKYQEASGLYPYGVLDITTQLSIINSLNGQTIYLDKAFDKALEIAKGKIDTYIKEISDQK